MSELAIAVAAGLLSGGAVALLSFLLAARHDRRKSEREHAGHQALLVRSLIREMEANRRSCSSNLTLLAVEREDLERRTNAGLGNPPVRLETGAWTLARIDLPSDLIRDEDLFSRLSIIASKSREVNQILANRDLFHILHVSSDYSRLVDGLKVYARIAEYPMRDLIDRIDEALGEVDGFAADPAAD